MQPAGWLVGLVDSNQSSTRIRNSQVYSGVKKLVNKALRNADDMLSQTIYKILVTLVRYFIFYIFISFSDLLVREELNIIRMYSLFSRMYFLLRNFQFISSSVNKLFLSSNEFARREHIRIISHKFFQLRKVFCLNRFIFLIK